MILAPPPFPLASIASNSTENIEHGTANTSQSETNQRKKQKTEETVEDQVVPNTKRRGIKLAVIEHNGFDDYYVIE